MKAGLSPIKDRSLDSHLDLLARRKAERNGDHQLRQFGSIAAKLWPTGRLEITFPDGFHEPDLNKRDPREIWLLKHELPDLADALKWAGWH